MVDWRRVPWPLWVVCAGMLWPMVRIEVGTHGPVLAKVLFPALILGWIYLLLRGKRWVWQVILAVDVLELAWVMVLGPWHWIGIVVSLVELVLLLLPVTRRYFSPGRVVAPT